MPQHLDLAGDVVELLGHVLADLCLGAAASAGALARQHVVEHVATWQMITDGASAVPLAVLRGWRVLQDAVSPWAPCRRDGLARAPRAVAPAAARRAAASRPGTLP